MNTTIQLRMMVTTTAAALLVALVAPAAEAHHRPTAYCSESGDVCQSVRKHDGVRKARITLAARYFRAYVLCVHSPLGYEPARGSRSSPWIDPYMATASGYGATSRSTAPGATRCRGTECLDTGHRRS